MVGTVTGHFACEPFPHGEDRSVTGLLLWPDQPVGAARLHRLPKDRHKPVLGDLDAGQIVRQMCGPEVGYRRLDPHRELVHQHAFGAARGGGLAGEPVIPAGLPGLELQQFEGRNIHWPGYRVVVQEPGAGSGGDSLV